MEDQGKKFKMALSTTETTDHIPSESLHSFSSIGTTEKSSPQVTEDRIGQVVSDLNSLEEQVKKNFEESKKEIERSKSMSYLGFFALAIVVIGFAFSYFEFIFGGAVIDSYERDIGVKIGNHDLILGNLKSENEKLKNQIDSMEKILNCQKAKDKRYWEYQKCFE